MDNRFRKPTEQDKLRAFIADYKNWRPPSNSTIARYMGWKSNNAAFKAVNKLKQNGTPRNSPNNKRAR